MGAFSTKVAREMAYNTPNELYPPHPYYPLEINIAGYLANEWGVLTLLGTFSAGCALIFTFTYLIVTRVRQTLPTSELLTILWFVLSGCIHFFFEGYYVYNFRAMGHLQDLFGQLWKEYALSDSRYLTLDPFVLCMETITAVSNVDMKLCLFSDLCLGMLGPIVIHSCVHDLN